MADNKVRFGLSNVHVAFLVDGEYGTPAEIPGAVSMSLDPSGDSVSFYADNSVYFTQTKNNGYEGSLEVALMPDSVKALMMGDYIDANGKYIEDADGTPGKFALMFQIEGDAAARRGVLYEVTAARSSVEGNTTEESISPDTESFDITAVPHKFDSGKRVPMAFCNEEDAEYSTFFDAVTVPGDAA